MTFTDIPQGDLKARLPGKLRAFLELARLDRPTGTWLLLFPCFWSLALSQSASPRLYALFALGAVVMRGAGCTINDIVDRRLDAAVERTRGRPLPSRRLSLAEAVGFLGVQLALGLAVLWQFNRLSLELGAASLVLVAAYPFMKRITWWPQAFLGLTFNWGALLGWAAATDTVAAPAVILYAGGLAWTLGYDTIYAHQDKRDDVSAGIKSTARRFGHDQKRPVYAFYLLACLLIAVAGATAGADWRFQAVLATVALFSLLMVRRWSPDVPSDCLKRFKANAWIGLGIFAAIVAGTHCT